MKKALLILPALLCAACERESDIDPWCIENVDAVQVYDIKEYTDGKYAWASTCNVKNVDTNKCIGGRVVISMVQMPDIKIGQIIKIPKDECFYFDFSLNKMPTKTTLVGKIENFWPLVDITSKYSITTRRGYNYFYNFAYDSCLKKYSNEPQFDTKYLCTCITNDLMEKTLDMYINNHNKLDDIDFYSKTVAKCRAIPSNVLQNIPKKTLNRKVIRNNPKKTTEVQPDNSENSACIKDIHSVHVLAKRTQGDFNHWMGAICRQKEGDQGFCLGEYVVIPGDAFTNIQVGQRLLPANDECFIYYADTNLDIIVNGKRQSVKILGQGTKYSIFTENGYQYRYNETYNGCIQRAKNSSKYNKEADKLMCECYAGFVTDIVRDLAKIENKTIKHLLEKIVAWRFYKGLDYQCGPGTEVFQKVKELRNPE